MPKIFIKSNKGTEGFEEINSMDFANKTGMFKVVNMPQFDVVNYATLEEIADNENLDIFVINTEVSPKIVKILDMQKYIYELKKAKKENDKKQKAAHEKNKEIRISLNISDHDLDIKVNHTKEFADKGSKVKFILRLRGREGTGASGKEYVHKFFNYALTKFEGYTISEIKMIGNSIWVDITK